MSPNFLKSAIVILIITFFGSCRTTFEAGPFGARTAYYNGGESEGLILANEKARCKPMLEKRIIHGLFVLPFNGLSPEERQSIQRAGSVRIREVMRGGDIGITFLGFLLSIVSRTRVYEQCEGGNLIVSKGEREAAGRLREELEKLQEENRALKARLEERENSREEEKKPEGVPEAEKGKEAPPGAP